jgi:hypothetical protein
LSFVVGDQMNKTLNQMLSYFRLFDWSAQGMDVFSRRRSLHCEPPHTGFWNLPLRSVNSSVNSCKISSPSCDRTRWLHYRRVC